MSKQKVHFIHQSLLSANNPISVNVIGAGGTGSHLIDSLARINLIMTATGRAGFHVNLFDPDQIERPNLGRAAFNENYLGLNKAVAVINHINRKYGTNWKAIPTDFIPKNGVAVPKNRMANLTFSCVDTIQSRFAIAKTLTNIGKSRNAEHQRDRPLYLMDFGNSRKTGQVMLGTVAEIPQPDSDLFDTIGALPLFTEEFKATLTSSSEADQAPSCSIMEALNKQSLFINSTLVQHAAALIDEMFSDGVIGIRGFFLNLETHRVEPVRV